MLECYLFKFPKKATSTATPFIKDGKRVFITLKDRCSAVSPALELTGPEDYSEFPVSEFNYAYIPYFKRYYYVRDWEWSLGLWSFYLEVDVLASFKSDIGKSFQYVLRSSKTFNGTIRDDFYPTESEIVRSNVTTETEWTAELADGSYVLGIIGKNPDMGSVNYIYMTHSQVKALLHYLLDDADWLSGGGVIADISEGLLKAITNPLQYIVSCTWYPFHVPHGGNMTGLDYGWYFLSGLSYNEIDGTPVYTNMYEFTIPEHPQRNRGHFVNIAPYSSYVLDFKPFGQIPLDSMALMGTNRKLYCHLTVDCITGQAELLGSTDADGLRPIFVKNAMLGVPIELAQIARDWLGTAATALGTAGSVIGAAAAGNVIGSITGTASGIASTVASAAPKLWTSGSNGTLISFTRDPNIIIDRLMLVDDDNAHRGRPLCQIRRLDQIPGFIMCADAVLETSSTKEENDMIRGYLNSGFYYE